MKKLIFLLNLISIIIAEYSRNDAVNYTKKNLIKQIIIVILLTFIVLLMHIMEMNIVVLIHMEEIVQIL